MYLAQDSPTAASALLGATATTEVDGRTVAIRINEVEAYLGKDDEASHAFGARTARNEPMFAAAGTIYVYRSYGIHWCMSIVAGPQELPQAVLLRGGRVVNGYDTVVERRGRTDQLANGPGKLCQALGVTGIFTATHLSTGSLSLSGLGTVESFEVTPRIGISRATALPLRFLTLDS